MESGELNARLTGQQRPEKGTDMDDTDRPTFAGTSEACCSAPDFTPHAYFKIKSVTHPGDRDKRGRFVKAQVTLTQCQPEEAEFAVGTIWSRQVFTLCKTPNKEVKGATK
jgi:hypothetical protein